MWTAATLNEQVMTRTHLYIALLFGACLCLACSREDRDLLGVEGTLRLGMQVNEEVEVVSRAGEASSALNEDELKDKCRIRIYKGDKLVYKHSGWDETLDEEGLSLSSGVYRVRITSGDSVAASFDKKFYEGNEEFEIRQHQTTSVDVVCHIGNTLAKVSFDSSLKKYLAEAEVTVAVDADEGSLSYLYDPESGNSATGYYSLPEGREYLVCTLTGTSKSGKKFTQTDRIENARKSVLYTLTYTKDDTAAPAPPTDEGGGYLDLVVDETPLFTQEEEVMIYQRPKLLAVNNGEAVDMTQPWYLELGTQIAPEVSVYASTPLDGVRLESDLLERMGLPSSVDLMEESVRISLQAKGIEVSVAEKSLTMRWGASLNPYLVEEGEYHIRYTVADSGIEGESEAKTTEVDWVLSVSNANVTAIDIPYVYKIWADRATLYGKVIEGRDAPSAPLYFHYRRKGDSTWSESVPASLDGDYIVSEEIKGLTPGTEYEYQIMEGEKVSNATCTFVTEAALQLPNNSFENWSGDIPKLIYGSEESMFWDSGNHGSEKVDMNVTTPDSGIKNKGTYSARLESLFASMLGFGQFAAGNLFIGQYLETQMDGFTGHGVLGLGRALGADTSGNPVTSRPLALRGYIRYISGTVDKGGDKIADGSKDQGIIYMALTDGEGEEYEGSRWSFVIKTKDSKFFDKNAANVIAYGEKIWTENTEGDGMVPFEIRFNYDEKEDGRMRIPNRIMLVAAASRYGDYFQGSTESRMWLDDLELIYEESKLNEPIQ